MSPGYPDTHLRDGFPDFLTIGSLEWKVDSVGDRLVYFHLEGLFLRRLPELIGHEGGPPAVIPPPLGLGSLMLWRRVRNLSSEERGLGFKS